jgi:inositol transport system permease protein
MIKDKAIGFLKSQPQFVILIFLLIVLSVTTPKFASAANFINILKQVSVISIISCGLTLVVISGSLDLSIGSVFSLLSVVAVTMQTKNILFAILLPIAFAIAVGLFNGLIITVFEVNSIIVTLGSLSVFAGLALIYTNGGIVLAQADTWFSIISKGKVLGIPINVLIFIFIAILYEVILKKTSFGRKLIYMGSNHEAAMIVGIRTGVIKTIAFIISSVSVAIAAIILSSRLVSASPVSGMGFEFDAITAVVIGGTSLRGGKGSIYNTIIGVLLLAIIINALTLYNIPYAFQNISKGLLIMLAITADVRGRGKFGG